MDLSGNLTTLVTEEEIGTPTFGEVKFIPGNSKRLISSVCFFSIFSRGDCQLKIWDTESGTEIKSISTSYVPTINVRKFNMAISPNGQLLATIASDKTCDCDIIKLWALPSVSLLTERAIPHPDENLKPSPYSRYFINKPLLFVTNNHLVTMTSAGFILLLTFDEDIEFQIEKNIKQIVRRDDHIKIKRVIQIPYSCTPMSKPTYAHEKRLTPERLFLTANGKLGVKCGNVDAGIKIFDLNTGQLERNFAPYDENLEWEPLIMKIPGDSPPVYISDTALSQDMKKLAIGTEKGILLMSIPISDDVPKHSIEP